MQAELRAMAATVWETARVGRTWASPVELGAIITTLHKSVLSARAVTCQVQP